MVVAYRSYMDQTLGYFDRPHVGLPDTPVESAAAWRGDDLGGPDVWSTAFTEGEIDDLVALGRRLGADLDALGAQTLAEVSAPALEGRVGGWRRELHDGRGFIVLHGFPVDRLSLAECEAAYWALGLLLGRPGAQNGAGELLGHVRDYHEPAERTATIREYRTTVDINFHCDAADAVGLLCWWPAAKGGASRLVSSAAVFNEMLRVDRDLAARLCEPVELDARSDGEGFSHVPVQPVCFDGTTVRTFMHLGYFRSAARHADVALDARLVAALDLWESIATSPEMHVDMDLVPGDLQLCSNHSIAHARTGYVDDPDHPRHLLRLWLTFD